MVEIYCFNTPDTACSCRWVRTAFLASQIGQLLGIISANECNQGRPMLSAICVGKNGRPGEGFLPYAKDLGYFKDGEDQETFWKSECDKVYEEWKIFYRISHTKEA